MEEKREVKQIKKYDEDGNLECIVIPNYRKCDYFMSVNEIRFYKFLVKIIATIRENENLNLEVYPQVALNRIIRQNNMREKELEKDLFGKSIDYVIYDKNTNQIVCCIELDGPEHQTAEKRIERDKMIDRAFKSCDLELIHQSYSDNYDIEDYIRIIKNCIKNNC